MKKYFFVLSIFLLSLISCATKKNTFTQLYDLDGTPVWVGKTFSDSNSLWTGLNKEKGYYAWGEAKSLDEISSFKIADLDAELRLLNFVNSKLSNKKLNHLAGAYRVDSYISKNGTIYVLFFISNKNVKQLLR